MKQPGTDYLGTADLGAELTLQVLGERAACAHSHIDGHLPWEVRVQMNSATRVL